MEEQETTQAQAAINAAVKEAKPAKAEPTTATLKAMVRKLEAENQALRAQNEALVKEITNLNGQIAQAGDAVQLQKMLRQAILKSTVDQLAALSTMLQIESRRD